MNRSNPSTDGGGAAMKRDTSVLASIDHRAAASDSRGSRSVTTDPRRTGSAMPPIAGALSNGRAHQRPARRGAIGAPFPTVCCSITASRPCVCTGRAGRLEQILEDRSVVVHRRTRRRRRTSCRRPHRSPRRYWCPTRCWSPRRCWCPTRYWCPRRCCRAPHDVGAPDDVLAATVPDPVARPRSTPWQSAPPQSVPHTMFCARRPDCTRSAGVASGARSVTDPLPAALRRCRRRCRAPHDVRAPDDVGAQVWPSQRGGCTTCPTRCSAPLMVEAVPQTMLAAQAEPRGSSAPPVRQLVAPDDLLAPDVCGRDSASPGRAERKKRASCTAPFALRKPAPCVSGS